MAAQIPVSRSSLESLERTSHSLSDRFAVFLNRYSPSFILENNGSTARDHLANERTFLSYLRTSLSFVTVGIAISQLYRLKSPDQPHRSSGGQWLGSVFIVLGLLFIGMGTLRYFYAQNLMVLGMFPASRGSVTVASFVVVFVTVAAFLMALLE